MTTKTFCDICQKEVKEGHSLSTYREDLLVEELDLCEQCFNKFCKLLDFMKKNKKVIWP